MHNVNVSNAQLANILLKYTVCSIERFLNTYCQYSWDGVLGFMVMFWTMVTCVFHWVIFTEKYTETHTKRKSCQITYTGCERQLSHCGRQLQIAYRKVATLNENLAVYHIIFCIILQKVMLTVLKFLSILLFHLQSYRTKFNVDKIVKQMS